MEIDDAAAALAKVREKYAPLLAEWEPTPQGPRAGQLLDEFRGLRRLSRRAARRILGRP